MTALPICFNKEDRIAIIAPHPDDECIGVGGVMLKYPSQCDLFIVTDGRQGNILVEPDVEARIRREQFEEEMKLVKVNTYYWLGYQDGALMTYSNNILADIDFSCYTKIFIPWGDDNHSDHAAVWSLAIKCFQKKAVKAEVYQYEVHVPFHDVSHYVDITEMIEKKIELINCHKDQVNAVPYPEIARSLGRYRACQGNKINSYWETFLKVDLQDDSNCNSVCEREKTLQKYQSFYRLLLRWLKIHQDGKKVTDCLLDNQWRKITIYGFSSLGKLFYEELDFRKIELINILDSRDIQDNVEGIPILKPEKGDTCVDAVIVTAITSYNEIEKKLKEMGYSHIVSLQYVLEKCV